MEYSNKQPIKLREYGKAIQDFVLICKNEPDKEKRTGIAYTIIELMSQVAPYVKSTANYKKKLWDHLFFIADYELDVDAPYEISPREFIVTTPDKFHYPDRDIKYKHYGKYISQFIEKASEKEDEKKDSLAGSLASYMKLVHKNWNNEIVNDEIVKNDLSTISKGNLEMQDDESIKRLMPNINNNFRKKGKTNKNQKHRKPNNKNKRRNNNNNR